MTGHLEVTYTDRGFKTLIPLPSRYGGQVEVYESSNAEHPHIWLIATAPENLNRPKGKHVEAPILLTVEDAEKLADQLRFLIDNHYQN